MTLNQNIKTPTPVLAVIGIGDLAMEKLRAAGTDVQARSSKINLEPKRLQADFEAFAKQGVEDVKAAPAKAQAKAQETLHEVVAQATNTYDGLAGRGKTLVDRIRKQEATQDVVRTAQQTKTQAKGTATTARKSAAQTKSRAKGTTTSAKKTTGVAKTAAKKSADKIGD
ncbi:MAG: hypothetical protein ACRDOJ_00730 [Nocardioidaceae bacterium]